MKASDTAWQVSHDRIITTTVSKAVDAGGEFFTVEAEAWDRLAEIERANADRHRRDMESAQQRACEADQHAAKVRLP